MDRVMAAQVFNRICETGSLEVPLHGHWEFHARWSAVIWKRWKNGPEQG